MAEEEDLTAFRFGWLAGLGGHGLGFVDGELADALTAGGFDDACADEEAGAAPGVPPQDPSASGPWVRLAPAARNFSVARTSNFALGVKLKSMFSCGDILVRKLLNLSNTSSSVLNGKNFGSVFTYSKKDFKSPLKPTCVFTESISLRIRATSLSPKLKICSAVMFVVV